MTKSKILLSQLDNNVHRLPIRVYYEDTDAGGIVYYANYLKYAERARTELLREIGVAHELIKKTWGVEFVVRSCHAEYLKPAFLDDLLSVNTTCSSVKGASIIMQQDVFKDQTCLVQIQVKIASRKCDGGSATRLPIQVRSAFKKYVLNSCGVD